jgi:hypothetical protein
MLQFQIASAIQEAIVREYPEYQENDVSVFVEWLVQYCIHHTGYSVFAADGSLQKYIRDAILRAAAVALKRLSMSLTFNVTQQILSLVEKLADQNAPSQTVSSLSALTQKMVYLSCLVEYIDTFILSQTTKNTTFHLPLEQHTHAKSQLETQILQPLWVTLTQVLEKCITLPPTDDVLTQKAVICCETIISWDFGIEEGTFRRVSFGPVVVNDDDDDDDDKQPIWPGSWGSVINEFVVDLMFKVRMLGSRIDSRYTDGCKMRQIH